MSSPREYRLRRAEDQGLATGAHQGKEAGGTSQGGGEGPSGEQGKKPGDWYLRSQVRRREHPPHEAAMVKADEEDRGRWLG